MLDITHIHPMLVHFPIVLFIVGAILSTYLLIKKEDLAKKNNLQLTNAAALLAGLGMALLASQFGDIALDAAVEKGFALAPLEEHEELATITIILFSILTAALFGAMWKGISLKGARAIIFVGIFYAGVAVLLTTAYHGGNLVYKQGVNVELVTPTQQPTEK